MGNTLIFITVKTTDIKLSRDEKINENKKGFNLISIFNVFNFDA